MGFDRATNIPTVVLSRCSLTTLTGKGSCASSAKKAVKVIISFCASIAAQRVARATRELSCNLLPTFSRAAWSECALVFIALIACALVRFAPCAQSLFSNWLCEKVGGCTGRVALHYCKRLPPATTDPCFTPGGVSETGAAMKIRTHGGIN